MKTRDEKEKNLGFFQLQDKQRVVLECCRGYARSEEEGGSTCLPVCTDMCLHGTCVGPDTCHCEQGFGGKDCSKCKNDNYSQNHTT